MQNFSAILLLHWCLLVKNLFLNDREKLRELLLFIDKRAFTISASCDIKSQRGLPLSFFSLLSSRQTDKNSKSQLSNIKSVFRHTPKRLSKLVDNGANSCAIVLRIASNTVVRQVPPIPILLRPKYVSKKNTRFCGKISQFCDENSVVKILEKNSPHQGWKQHIRTSREHVDS